MKLQEEGACCGVIRQTACDRLSELQRNTESQGSQAVFERCPAETVGVFRKSCIHLTTEPSTQCRSPACGPDKTKVIARPALLLYILSMIHCFNFFAASCFHTLNNTYLVLLSFAETRIKQFYLTVIGWICVDKPRLKKNTYIYIIIFTTIISKCPIKTQNNTSYEEKYFF